MNGGLFCNIFEFYVICMWVGFMMLFIVNLFYVLILNLFKWLYIGIYINLESKKREFKWKIIKENK